AAIGREFGRGFISESNPGSVVIFDLKTLKPLKEVPVGKDPNLVLVDHATERVFTADRGDKQLSALDAKTGSLVGKVGPFDGRTEHGASDEKGYVFLNLQDKGLLLKIDARALKVVSTLPIGPGVDAVEFDSVRKLIYVASGGDGTLSVFHEDTPDSYTLVQKV